jgi:hypothetical protein
MSDKNMDKICQALEDMMDAADDAWEAEQRGHINKRDSIKESRYASAKEQFRQALDDYIDQRIARMLPVAPVKGDYDNFGNNDVEDL